MHSFPAISTASSANLCLLGCWLDYKERCHTCPIAVIILWLPDGRMCPQRAHLTLNWLPQAMVAARGRSTHTRNLKDSMACISDLSTRGKSVTGQILEELAPGVKLAQQLRLGGVDAGFPMRALEPRCAPSVSILALPLTLPFLGRCVQWHSPKSPHCSHHHTQLIPPL